MVDEIIAFLNDKNREYAEGKAGYNWSVWGDNCAHTLQRLSSREYLDAAVCASNKVPTDTQSCRACKRVR